MGDIIDILNEEQQRNKIRAASELAREVVIVDQDHVYHADIRLWKLRFVYRLAAADSSRTKGLSTLAEELGVKVADGFDFRNIERAEEQWLTAEEASIASVPELSSMFFDDGMRLQHQARRIMGELEITPSFAEANTHEDGKGFYARQTYIFNSGPAARLNYSLPIFGGIDIPFLTYDAELSVLQQIEDAFREDPVFPVKPTKTAFDEGRRVSYYRRKLSRMMPAIPISAAKKRGYQHAEALVFFEPERLVRRS